MAELDARKPREHMQRESEPVHEAYPEYYDDDALLSTENIPAREGYVQRWVRTSIHGNEDQSNVFKKVNKGWKPRERSTVPKGQYVMHVDFEGLDVIGIRGMILMERPIALHERQRKKVQEATQLQMQAVKNDLYKMREPNARVSEFTDKTEVSRGRIAAVDD
jgi:hypothetical protein